MAKGSGTTRSSSSGSPRGISSNGFPQEVIDRAAAELRASIAGRRTEYEKRVQKDIKIIQTRGFKDMGGGVWELNSENADVAIIEEYRYGEGSSYMINALGARWSDGEYRDAAGSGEREAYERRFATLNAAKAAAREELEKYYRRHNR